MGSGDDRGEVLLDSPEKHASIDAQTASASQGVGGRQACRVHSPSSVGPLIDLLGPKYFKYLDVRYFTYTSLDKIAKNCNSIHMTGNETKKAYLHNKGELSESRTLNRALGASEEHPSSLAAFAPMLPKADLHACQTL